MKIIKIKAINGATWNEADRLDFSRLLVKAGYTVRIGKDKVSNGKTTRTETFVEASDDWQWDNYKNDNVF